MPTRVEWNDDRKVETVGVIPLLMLPDGSTAAIGTLDSLTVSTHRSMYQVFPFGRVSPKGVTKGTRTVAGSLVFSQLFETIVRQLLPHYSQYGVMADEVPPFDILLVLPGSETGTSDPLMRPSTLSYKFIRGIYLMDGNEVYSIDNISPEEQYSYIAMESYGLRPDQAVVAEYLNLMGQQQSFSQSADRLGPLSVTDVPVY